MSLIESIQHDIARSKNSSTARCYEVNDCDPPNVVGELDLVKVEEAHNYYDNTYVSVRYGLVANVSGTAYGGSWWTFRTADEASVTDAATGNTGPDRS